MGVCVCVNGWVHACVCVCVCVCVHCSYLVAILQYLDTPIMEESDPHALGRSLVECIEDLHKVVTYVQWNM